MYNLGRFLQRRALPLGVNGWTPTTLRNRLMRIRAKAGRHAECARFCLAEVAVPRNLFAPILDRIQRMRPALSMDTLIMTPQTPQKGFRCNRARGWPVPLSKNRAKKRPPHRWQGRFFA